MECNICHEFYLDENRQFYMRALSLDQVTRKFIFYDFERHQNNEGNEHIPNFVVADTVCEECEKNPIDENATCENCGSRCEICDKYNHKLKEWEKSPCVGCGKRQIIFSGTDTKDKFCKWLIHE